MEQHNVGVQVILDVNVALRDAQGRRVVEPAGNEGILRNKRQAGGRGPRKFIPPQEGGCHLVHRPIQRLCLPCLGFFVAGIAASSSSCNVRAPEQRSASLNLLP